MNAIDPRSNLSFSQDRRHGRRRKLDSVVYLNIQPDNGGILLDLSEDGMCISVANPLVAHTRIDFSLSLEQDRPVTGAGVVCWLSASGRSAGVRFADWPAASRERVRQWMAGNGVPLSKAKAEAPRKTAAAVTAATAAAATARAPVVSVPPPAPAPSEAPAEAPQAAENVEKHAEPQTPLFFFPHKQEPDPEVEERLPWQPSNYTPWGQKTEAGRDDEEVAAYRSAIGTSSENDEENEEQRRDRRFQKFFMGTVVSLALLAAGVAGLVAYPNQVSKLRQFAVSFTAPRTAPPEVTTETHRFVRRFRRYVTPKRADRGPQRGSRPVRDTSVFDAPRRSKSSFSMQVTDPSNQRWLATASSRTFVPRETPPDTSVATPAANAPASAPSESAVFQPPGETGAMRVDGGLVEEGAVSPTFAPLNLKGQTLVPKPIVVEAVIGKDGSVENVHLLSSPTSQLANAVVAAVKLWHYRPFYRNGQPTEFVTRITFDFSLPKANR